jgi:tetratricopeptide (TPR) repeat protein
MRSGHPLIVVAAVALLGAAIALQMGRDRAYPRPEVEARLLYVRSPAAIRRMVLGFDALAADLYWIRAIQHYGGDRLAKAGSRRRYELLYPLLDLTTALDPSFNIAYRFGAIFLSEPYPGGPGRPDQAVALLKKGIAANPGQWQYYMDVGFIYYWHVRDFQGAAEWFHRAARQPNAPAWLTPLAATVLGATDDRNAARFMWRQLLEADQEWLRQRAQRGLVQLDALDLIERFQPLVLDNRPPEGQPYTWEWLIRRGVLRAVPADPTGTPFSLHPLSGEVTVSQRSPLYPMPEYGRRLRQ